ncbi:hypothetical protein GPK34_00935 [Secundilactobacillus kimchicus]|uniref:hypothetical protein n=1 Tax=Secundilactobacillus kimchicus TaxID=528209 RepID=UPI001C00A652|nr:hypothetical protein [Secundilactobacillus kimchicus]MBT9670603.1 hypothetical protein [Secundilactobacillus kimchicus]
MAKYNKPLNEIVEEFHHFSPIDEERMLRQFKNMGFPTETSELHPQGERSKIYAPLASDGRPSLDIIIDGEKIDERMMQDHSSSIGWEEFLNRFGLVEPTNNTENEGREN